MSQVGPSTPGVGSVPPSSSSLPVNRKGGQPVEKVKEVVDSSKLLSFIYNPSLLPSLPPSPPFSASSFESSSMGGEKPDQEKEEELSEEGNFTFAPFPEEFVFTTFREEELESNTSKDAHPFDRSKEPSSSSKRESNIVEENSQTTQSQSIKLIRTRAVASAGGIGIRNSTPNSVTRSSHHVKADSAQIQSQRLQADLSSSGPLSSQRSSNPVSKVKVEEKRSRKNSGPISRIKALTGSVGKLIISKKKEQIEVRSKKEEEEEDFPTRNQETISRQMSILYRLSLLSLDLGLTIMGEDIHMYAYQDIPLDQQTAHFEALINLIQTNAHSSRSVTCTLDGEIVMTYSELLRRLASCKWGNQILMQQENEKLKSKLDRLMEKLIQIEFGVNKEMRAFLTKKQETWLEKKKDVEKTFSNPPYKIFYRHKKNQMYILPLDVKKGNLHFLGKGAYKSASRLLNYTTGEVLACSSLVQGTEKAAEDMSRRELECLQRLKGTPGVLSLIDVLEYEVEGEKEGEKIKRLALITPLCKEGVLGGKEKIHDAFDYLGQQEKLEMMGDLLSGLKAIHDAKIVHGDISTSNILIRRDPKTNKSQAFIFDFGHAEIYSGNEMGGNPEKMFEKRVGIDIFEMGKVLYQLFMDPNNQTNFKDWSGQNLTYDANDPDMDIKEIIHLMLKPNPEQRPNSEALLNFFNARILNR